MSQPAGPQTSASVVVKKVSWVKSGSVPLSLMPHATPGRRRMFRG
ncbi:hypothetical protein [Corynebacterium halotolerans]